MKKKINMTLGLLAITMGSLIANNSVYADKTSNTASLLETTSNKVEVGTRVDLTENELPSEQFESEKEELITRGLFYTSHHGAYHFPDAISYLGDNITLEDGSCWDIPSYDWWKTEKWLASDPLLITQNKFAYSNYQFMIVNQNTGHEVEANLLMGPFINGHYTHWITHIDYFNQQVFLEDGTVWDIVDRRELHSWRINDTMIIGVNRQANFDFPNILINVNTLNYGRGINLSN